MRQGVPTMLRLGREERVLPSSPHTAKDWSHGEGEKRKGKSPPSPTPPSPSPCPVHPPGEAHRPAQLHPCPEAVVWESHLRLHFSLVTQSFSSVRAGQGEGKGQTGLSFQKSSPGQAVLESVEKTSTSLRLQHRLFPVPGHSSDGS